MQEEKPRRNKTARTEAPNRDQLLHRSKNITRHVPPPVAPRRGGPPSHNAFSSLGSENHSKALYLEESEVREDAYISDDREKEELYMEARTIEEAISSNENLRRGG